MSGITVDELRDRLAKRPNDGRAVVRLVAAREYKAGRSPADIEEKYGWPAGTVYHWLEYIETRGIDGGLTPRDRSGRPPKLSESEREQLATVLRRPPTAVGYEQDVWQPAVVRRYIRREFNVGYSIRHVRRVMRSVERARE